jgi:hypothetical protein
LLAFGQRVQQIPKHAVQVVARARRSTHRGYPSTMALKIILTVTGRFAQLPLVRISVDAQTKLLG